MQTPGTLIMDRAYILRCKVVDTALGTQLTSAQAGSARSSLLASHTPHSTKIGALLRLATVYAHELQKHNYVKVSVQTEQSCAEYVTRPQGHMSRGVLTPRFGRSGPRSASLCVVCESRKTTLMSPASCTINTLQPMHTLNKPSFHKSKHASKQALSPQV
jgi:hypothetical protein